MPPNTQWSPSGGARTATGSSATEPRQTDAAGGALHSETLVSRQVRERDQRHHDLLVPRPDVVGCYGLGSLQVEAEPFPMPGGGRPLPKPAVVVSGLGVKETQTS